MKLFCPVCLEESNHEVLLKAQNGCHSLYKCVICDLRRLYPIEEVDIKQGLYEKESKKFEPSKFEYSIKSAKYYLEEVKKINSDNKMSTLLDLGSGLGYYSNAFSHLGLKVTGIEPDAVSANFAKTQEGFNANIFNGSLKEYVSKYNDPFDIIFCRHVIEHFIDPIDILKDLKKLCNEDTVLVFETDNNESPEVLLHPDSSKYWIKNYFDNYEVYSVKELISKKVTALGLQNTHYFAYNKSNCSKLLDNVGFKVLKVEDYNLGHEFLWPNINNYSDIKSIILNHRQWKRVLTIIRFLHQKPLFEGAGIILFAKIND